MKKNVLIFLALGLTSAFLSQGCQDIGSTPAGASQTDMKSAFDKLSLDERAKMLMDRPGPMEDKVKHITEMYKKEGKEPPADLTKLGGGKAPDKTAGN